MQLILFINYRLNKIFLQEIIPKSIINKNSSILIAHNRKVILWERKNI